MKQRSRETLWIGWDRPVLPMAAQAIIDHLGADGDIDWRQVLCVLPTARSVRGLASQFESLFSLDSGGASVSAEPELPHLITVGELPEWLYSPSQPVALDFEQTMAWAKVMMGHNRDQMSALVPILPGPSPLTPWLELASTIRRLHEDLSSSNLSFADVIPHAETDNERKRWELLAKLLIDYRNGLMRVGLSDPHLARADAVARQACRSNKTIVLVGTSDISDMLTLMLQKTDAKIVSVIAAPPEASNWFNEFGCVVTDKWLGHELPVVDDNLVTASDISDQAVAAVATLQSWDSESERTGNVVVGVTDESQVGPIEFEMRGCGRETFRSLGWKVSETAVGRLLRLTSHYLQFPTWRSLAALVRHADVAKAVSDSIQTDASEWLTQIDGVLNSHHPQQTRVPLPPLAIERFPLAIKVAAWVNQWLSDFLSGGDSSAGQVKPFSQWCELIAAWISSAPSHHPRTELAASSAEKLLRRLALINTGLDVEVTGGVAIEMLAGRLAEIRVMDTQADNSVPIVGWLDLAWEDADFLTVVGMNHPFVPASVTGDPFLPGTLRSKLRMQDNDRRYARDVYVMHLMLSTTTQVRFIVGKTGADQSPTPPSRLLAASEPADMARRLRFLLGGKRTTATPKHRWDRGPKETDIPIPAVPDHSPKDQVLTEMSVTSFSDYLRCPYRFYLRHVLRLKPLDDETRELAANQFGDLVHGALEEFGRSRQKDASEVGKIESALIDYLHEYANQNYGDDVSAPVRLQIAQAERRLRTVAIRQAERVNEGWVIHATEKSVNEKSGACIEVSEGKMGIRGRFDRIDFHPDTGRWAILDYKTHGDPPMKKHIKKKKWADLQLPLYRMMAPFLGIDAPPNEVQLGYFNVAQKDTETKINLAEFSEDQMETAEQLIHDCVRGVLLKQFEPTDQTVEFDDYAMILQTGILKAGSETLRYDEAAS